MKSLQKRDPLLTRLPTSGWLTFIVVVQEGNNKQFRVCLMSQNRVVVENKTIFETRTQSHVFLVLLVLVLVLDHA